jgi:uncharacterized membrane protein YdbT with pleckstrin-like domain
MRYVEKILEPGEKVRRWGKLHWIIYARAWMLFAISLVLVLGAGHFVSNPGQQHYTAILLILGVVFFVIAAVHAVLAWIERVTTEIAVTDYRVIRKTGLIRRATIEINALRVESVDVRQSVLGRLLGYGTVEVRGTGIGLEPLQRIADPIDLRRAVQSAHQSTLRRTEHAT